MRRFFKNLTDQQIELGIYAFAIAVSVIASYFVLRFSGGAWLKLWELLCAVVEPLAYGFMLSYMLNPVVAAISRMLKRRGWLVEEGQRRRAVAVSITAALIVVLLLALVTGFAILLANGISSLDLGSLQSVFDEATNDLAGFMDTVRNKLASWGFNVGDGENTILSTVMGMGNVATTMLFSAIFTVYFLIDGRRLYDYAHRVIRNALGDRAHVGAQLLDDADRVFSGYFRGQAIDASIVGVLSGVVLSIIGVPYAPVVGLLAALGNLIPYVGGPVGFGSIVVVCLSEARWGAMIAGLVAMALIMFVDGNIINPKLLSDNVEVHPMVVIVALIAGGAVGGIAGMLVAVPTAAWIKIQLDRWMDANEAAQAQAAVAEKNESPE